MVIEALLIRLALPEWWVALALTVAAVSFMTRCWTQARHGRIREYRGSELGVAAVLVGIAAFYLFLEAGEPDMAARPAAMRLLLTLLALATTAFNWGGVRAAVRDVRTAWKRGRE